MIYSADQLSPHHWAQLAGMGMSAAAGVGTAGVAKVRTRKYMEFVNDELFAARGLRVSICKDEELVRRLRCGTDQQALV